MIEQYIASDKVSMMYDLLEVVSETHYTIGKGKDDTGNEIQHRNVNPFLFRQFTGLFLDYADDLAPLLYINQEKVRFLQVLIGNVIISSEEEMSRVTDLSNGVLYGILQESDLPGSVKYGIYSAVANPRRTIRKLYEFVWQLYGRLAAIYRRNQDQLQAARKSLIKTIHSEGIYFIDQRTDLRPVSHVLRRKPILYILSLLKPITVEFFRCGDNSNVIIGLTYSKQLSNDIANFYRSIKNKGLSLQLFYRLIKLILVKPYTISDLSDRLGISKFQISEYLNLLFQLHIANICETGNQLVFSFVNKDIPYVEQLLDTINQIMQKEVGLYGIVESSDD